MKFASSVIISNDDDMDYYKKNMLNKCQINLITIKESYQNPVIPVELVSRRIIISSESVTKLPEKITCNFLDISNTSIKEIRSTHIIEDGLRACNMKHDLILPDDMELHYLDLNNSIHFSTIPKNLRVLSYLDVTKTNIKHIPDGTYIGTYLIYNYNSNSYVTIEGAVFNTIERNNLNLYEYCHSLSILS